MAILIINSIYDVLAVIPWLFLTYTIISLIEYKFANHIRDGVQKSGLWGPIIGAFAGIIPQCGFSVVGATLYGQKLATIGTLLAIFIATSDEAIPVIISQPEHLGVILPILFTKLLMAIIVGFLIDYYYRQSNTQIIKHIHDFGAGRDEVGHNHQAIVQVEACCGHDTCGPEKKLSAKVLFLHPLIHTFRIALYLFISIFLISSLVKYIGEDDLKTILSSHSIIQPIILAFLGLIPNCAVSVGITQFYLDGVISFGSVIAGLSASGGLGVLVLFRVESKIAAVLKILGILFLSSAFFGITINLLL